MKQTGCGRASERGYRTRTAVFERMCSIPKPAKATFPPPFRTAAMAVASAPKA